MALTIRQLLAEGLIKGMQVEAGLIESDPEISFVNVMEILDSPHTVEKGELLLTTGYGLDDKARHGKLIPTLKQRGVSGLLIQPGYYIDEIPAYIIKDATKYDFPVLTIPSDLSFSHLLHQLLDEIERNADEAHRFYRDLKKLLHQQEEEMDMQGRQLYLICPARNTSKIKEQEKGLAKIHSYLASVTEECSYSYDQMGCAFFICEAKDNLNVYKAIAHDLNMKIREVYEEFGVDFYVGAEEHSAKMSLDTMFEHAAEGLRILGRIRARRGACTYDNVAFVESFGKLYKNRGTAMEEKSILQMIINYDRVHKSEYVNTIQIYLASSCNIARTSERLYIHRHTLMNRLKMMKNLFGLDFTDHYARVFMSIDLLLRDYYSS